MKQGIHVSLDHTARGADAVDLERQLKDRVVGQDQAVEKLAAVLQTFMAGLNAPSRPIANVLFLGPTGTGKTRLVEALSDVLFNREDGFVKIDCAEFQEGHSIAKIMGAPSGYIGHKDTKPFLTQEKLDSTHTKDFKLSLVLFDELEKAHHSFWDLLLGIMDRGRLTLSDGTTIDFSRTIVLMTSNLGAREMGGALSKIGFGTRLDSVDDDRKLEKVSQDAARRRFSPEFWNRLDSVISFRTLRPDDVKRILRIEMGKVQKRILSSPSHQKFVFVLTPPVEDFLIAAGTDRRYGARELKRAIEKHVVEPLSNLVMSGQVSLGDLVRISLLNGALHFDKVPSDTVASLPQTDWLD
jgi:ATP-dependent Clp protease ATP-binding subunit ClpB